MKKYSYLDMTPETVLIGFSGCGGGHMHIGTYVGYQPSPTYIIQTESDQVSWAEELTREANPDEVIAYWRGRALAAEARRGDE